MECARSAGRPFRTRAGSIQLSVATSVRTAHCDWEAEGRRERGGLTTNARECVRLRKSAHASRTESPAAPPGWRKIFDSLMLDLRLTAPLYFRSVPRSSPPRRRGCALPTRHLLRSSSLVPRFRQETWTPSCALNATCHVLRRRRTFDGDPPFAKAVGRKVKP